MNVLAVGANPDDVEFLCAGTLAACASRGDRISIAYLTQGDKGGSAATPQEIAAVRRREAQAAAAMIGARLVAFGLPDGEVEVTLSLRRRVVEVIRSEQPDFIITHYPYD